MLYSRSRATCKYFYRNFNSQFIVTSFKALEVGPPATVVPQPTIFGSEESSLKSNPTNCER